MGVLPDWMIERDVKIEPFSPQQHRPGVISYGVTSYGYDVRAGYKWKVFDDAHGGVVDPKNFDPKLLREVDLTPPTDHDWMNPDSKQHNRCRRCLVYSDNPHKDTYLEKCIKEAQPNYVIIPPNSYALGESFETFTVPRDILVICVGKSTYARCGIIVNVTPGEPEWTGKWTIEISNSTRLPAKVYCGEGLMQCVFIRSDGYRETILNAIAAFSGYEVCRQLWAYLKSSLGTATCRTSYADKKGKYQDQSGLTLAKVEK